jgi:multimeric flavodoxin WrbA
MSVMRFGRLAGAFGSNIAARAPSKTWAGTDKDVRLCLTPVARELAHGPPMPASDASGPAEPPAVPEPRKGQGDVRISQEGFTRRLRERFYDPAFDAVGAELDRIIDVAWSGYDEYRKSPRKRKAGADFEDPDYELPVEWLEARDRIRSAERERADPSQRDRVLLIAGAARHDQTCPGEMSKTFRLAEMAREELERSGVECDFLDLSLLTAQYGRQILPCKACVSTAMPLCHWPCSCYPNHAMGQVNDWMHELYPRWVAAHGVMIVTPVYWYQAPSVLKLMMDRLVCADGGNPDPTTTHGKDPKLAKQLELAGWDYPRHLAGRFFSIVVHGDAAGTEVLRRSLTDWLHDMHLVQAGYPATIDRYVGYYEPYATSHLALDADTPLHEEVRVAARVLATAIRQQRETGRTPPGLTVADTRPK